MNRNLVKTPSQLLKRGSHLATCGLVSLALQLHGGTTKVTATSTAAVAEPRTFIAVRAIDMGDSKEPEGDVTWLGVYAEEVSEELKAQLNLNSGEGLLVTYVASNSPAADAGLQVNDVLTKLGDQLLVHPAQLVKLIRVQKEGAAAKLTLFRQGKSQTVTAKLGKRTVSASAWSTTSPGESVREVVRVGSAPKVLQVQMQSLHENLAQLHAEKQHLKAEVEQYVAETCKAIQDALTSKGKAGESIGLDPKDVQALARAGVDLSEDATIIVKKDGQAIRTLVQVDDTGTYVLLAAPKKHLTAHDKAGKLLFDGEIETEADQQKVPPAVWEKVKPLLPQLKSVEANPAGPNAQAEGEAKT